MLLNGVENKSVYVSIEVSAVMFFDKQVEITHLNSLEITKPAIGDFMDAKTNLKIYLKKVAKIIKII